MGTGNISFVWNISIGVSGWKAIEVSMPQYGSTAGGGSDVDDGAEEQRRGAC